RRLEEVIEGWSSARPADTDVVIVHCNGQRMNHEDSKAQRNPRLVEPVGGSGSCLNRASCIVSSSLILTPMWASGNPCSFSVVPPGSPLPRG
ncbi:MAG: hypothetical protein V2B18_02355, partial [Pseudomonadota bacterium]